MLRPFFGAHTLCTATAMPSPSENFPVLRICVPYYSEASKPTLYYGTHSWVLGSQVRFETFGIDSLLSGLCPKAYRLCPYPPSHPLRVCLWLRQPLINRNAVWQKFCQIHSYDISRKREPYFPLGMQNRLRDSTVGQEQSMDSDPHCGFLDGPSDQR